jgi:hypothetical protein
MKVILLSRHPENFFDCQFYQPSKPPSSHPERSEGPLVLLSELDYQMLKALNVDGTPAIFILRLFKKVPYSVLPSDSEASTPHFVLPRVARHPSLRSGRRPQGGDPSADASGRQQEGLHKNIFSTASGNSFCLKSESFSKSCALILFNSSSE